LARPILLFCLLLAIGCVTARAQSDDTSPVDYCLSQGGIVRERHPVWGTNLTTDRWVQLGGSRQFCEFTGGTGTEPGTWISLSLETHSSDLPTLATLAYLTKPPLPADTGTASPAAYCTRVLGGAFDWGGPSGAGGGWVTFNSEPPYAIMTYCVLPDGSMIDARGLASHTAGVIRGADLTPRFRYQSNDPPRIFVGQS
jgi:putative hemolysin